MPVKWLTLALNDLEQIQAFIAEDDLAAASRCVVRIQVAVDQLKRFPASGRLGRVPDTHELVVPGTPYILVYRIRARWVEILSVLHGSRAWPLEFVE